MKIIQKLVRKIILFITLLTGIILFMVVWVLFGTQKNITIRQIPVHQVKILIPELATDRAKTFYKKATEQIGVVKTYDFSNGYYGTGDGYPPADTGVCTDVIARAFDVTQGSLRKMVDADIQKNPDIYDTSFDTYINFRRVKNLDIFFSRKAKKLTNEMIPGDINNLSEWQTGDIVTFEKLPGKGLWHIGIISDERQIDGVPYMLDNHGRGTNILITPLDWPTKILGHYRYF